MRKLLVIGIFLLTSVPAKATSPTPVNLDSVFIDCVFGQGLPRGLCFFLVEELASNYGGSTGSNGGQGIRAINTAQTNVRNAENARNQAFNEYYSRLDLCMRAYSVGDTCTAGLQQLYDRYLQTEKELVQAQSSARAAIASSGLSSLSGLSGLNGSLGGGVDLVAIAQAIQQEQAARRAAEQAAINQLATLFANGSHFDLIAAALGL
jgi:hypothetical protein